MNVQFSASSLVGVTAISGVVVRSSLLIIDFVIDYLKAGLPLKDALIDAGAVRLRPILLTTLAILLGSGILVPVLLNYYFAKHPYADPEGGVR